MTTITTRSGKGSPLTNDEVDANFTNLNTDKAELSGASFTGNVSLGDNDKAIFGGGSDLQIYHTGTQNYIEDAGTGNLNFKSNGNFYNFLDGSNATVFQIDLDDATRLYHNTTQKLATTSTGIDVTGVITTDGMTTSADINVADNVSIRFGDATNGDLVIKHDGTNSFIVDRGDGDLLIQGSTNVKLQNFTGSKDYFVGSNGGASTVYYDGSAKLATTSTGIDVTGSISADGLTVDGGTTFNQGSGDSVNIFRSTDYATLKIGANATDHFYLQEFGSNDLYLARVNSSVGAYSAKFASNGDISFYDDSGSAKLFWDASAESLGIGTSSPSSKLSVSNAGAGGLEISPSYSGTRNLLINYNRSASAYTGIDFDATDYIFYGSGSERMRIDSSGNVGIGTDSPRNDANFKTLQIGDSSTAASQLVLDDNDSSGPWRIISNLSLIINDDTDERMRIDSSGGVLIGTTVNYGSFQGGYVLSKKGYVFAADDTGSTDNRNWAIAPNGSAAGSLDFIDSSSNTSWPNNAYRMSITKDGNVGIGNSSPSNKLQIIGGTSGVDQINLASNLSDNTVKGAGIVMTMYTNNTAALIGGLAVNGATNLLFGSSGTDHRGIQNHIWYTNTNYNSTSGNTERMRIDSSGNLYSQTTTLNVGTSSTETGMTHQAGQLQVSANGYQAAIFNRLQNGTIADFRVDGTAVGSTGTSSTANFNISSSQSGHVGLEFGSPNIMPMKDGALADDAVDLGISSQRFKDLYLSGGAYLGGTGSANHLDDYEEGTFIASLRGSSSEPSPLITADVAKYTKVGRKVHFEISFENESTTGYSGDISISGLPFTSGSGRTMCSVGHYKSTTWDTGKIPIAIINSNSAIVSFLNIVSGSAWVPATHNTAGAGRYIWVTGTYVV